MDQLLVRNQKPVPVILAFPFIFHTFYSFICDFHQKGYSSILPFSIGKVER